ncbi:MAG: YihY/virulence factor BrkB family protein [Streptosporangiaceae bacterium]
MTTVAPRVADPSASRSRWYSGLLRTLWLLSKGTALAGVRYRITGLAAEAAFWALLSMPPLMLGLVSSVGRLRGAFSKDEFSDWILQRARTVFTEPAVNDVVKPMLDDVVNGGKVEVVSLGFLLSLWAGSRAVTVYVDTISIAYGLADVRGIIRTRVKSFFLYTVGLLVAVIVLPLLVVGPALVRNTIPGGEFVVQLAYWPVVVGLSILFLSLLYHLSVPVRTAWWREVPGAVVALLIWIGGSVILRTYLSGTLSGVSVSASLAAPIAVMIWLYVAALAVLIGACLNAEVDRLWPGADTARARVAAEVKNQAF